MARLPILIAPDKRLKTVAEPVDKVTDSIRKLMDDMLETMYAAPGIGLAAPQVGILKRIVVMDLARDNEKPQAMRFINPRILKASSDMNTYNEGCLSLPDTYADITRPAEVDFAYQDETGKEHKLHASGLLATCIQHEIDHLNGVLFVDYLSTVKRSIILRKLQKAKKLGEFD